MATGGVFKAVYDLANRPINAGGQVKTGPVVFMNTDAGKRSCGIGAKKRAEHGCLTAGERQPVETALIRHLLGEVFDSQRLR